MPTTIAHAKAPKLEEIVINAESLANQLERIRQGSGKGKAKYVSFIPGKEAMQIRSRSGRIAGKRIYEKVRVAPGRKKRKEPMEGKAKLADFPIEGDDQAVLRAEIRSSLQPKEVADRLQVSPVTVNNYRKAGKLLGFKRANRFMYPAWQFDAVSGRPIEGLGDVLDLLFLITDSPTETLALMTAKRDFFEGRSLKDLLLDGKADEAVLGAKQSTGR